jgi:hypothetical protein
MKRRMTNRSTRMRVTVQTAITQKISRDIQKPAIPDAFATLSPAATPCTAIWIADSSRPHLVKRCSDRLVIQPICLRYDNAPSSAIRRPCSLAQETRRSSRCRRRSWCLATFSVHVGRDRAWQPPNVGIARGPRMPLVSTLIEILSGDSQASRGLDLADPGVLIIRDPESRLRITD